MKVEAVSSPTVSVKDDGPVDGEGLVKGDGDAYLLEQTLHYRYASPVRHLRHRLLVVPPALHGGQRRYDWGLTVTGSEVGVRVASDSFSNHVLEIEAWAVDDWIEFKTWALVGRSGSDRVVTLPSERKIARLLTPTPLTQPDAQLGEVGRQLSVTCGSGLEIAERACAWAHRALTYEWGVTNVRTAAASAVAGGRGVCQDYAHVMLAICRAAGMPARYVSGHLVGEGGSHAWVEVIVSSASAASGHAVAVAFDPTHDRQAGENYLTVAVGRDYADVPPTSGTFEGDCVGELSASKRLSEVAPGTTRP